MRMMQERVTIMYDVDVVYSGGLFLHSPAD